MPVRPTGEDYWAHALTFRSTDQAGNVEADRSVDVLIDTSPPPSVTDDGGDGWHASGWTMTDAADALERHRDGRALGRRRRLAERRRA